MLFQVSIGGLEQFAHKFWSFAGSAKVFAFHGEMGAGKTTLITALCKYKGVAGTLSSPTFSIINEYRFLEKGIEHSIFHIDLYRLNSIEEVVQVGVEECIYSGDFCFIEWPEKAPALLDELALHVSIKTISDTEREVRLEEPKALKL